MFKGCYDTLDIMTERLAEGFTEIGYEVLLVDTRSLIEGLSKVTSFVREGTLGVISFNNLGMNIELTEGKNLWDQLDIPLIDILVDHPFHYHDALVKAPKKTVVLCIDENHVDYIKRFYPNILISDFLPHAGTPFNYELKEISDRNIDVLYAGSLSGKIVSPEVLNEDRYSHINIPELWNYVMSYIGIHSECTTEYVIEKYLSEKNINLPDEELRVLFSDFRILDYYVVSSYRERILKVLVEAGIDVTIYGSGWDKCDWISAENCHVMGLVGVEELIPQMYDSKIVLNTMTWFKKGSHERIPNGMMAGAIVISDRSSYVDSNFIDGKNIVTFSLDDIETLPNRVREILSNIDQFTSVAQNGYDHAINNETWKKRAVDIDRCLFAPMLQ